MSIKIGSKYKWIKGDYIDNIEEISKIEENYVIFNSGKRCNIDLFNEFLIPLDENNTSSENEKNKKYKGVLTVNFTQEDDKSIFDEHGQPVFIPQSSKIEKQKLNINIEQQKEKNNNVINLLIAKSAKEECNFSIDINVKIPKKSFYFLLKESFNDIDIENEILNIALSEIDTKIKDIIKKQLLEKITTFYKS